MKLRFAAISAGGSACLVGGLLGWGFWATRQVPDFYQQALQQDPAEQQSANDQLLENATALASNVQREGQWQALFTADQINGWLAVDLARNFPELLPPGVVDPRVRIHPGGLTLGCRYLDGAVETVLSIEAEPYLKEPNVLAIRLRNARAGAMPVPLRNILDGLTQAAVEADLELSWLQAQGDPVAVLHLLPARDEGHTLYQLETLELREGEIYLAGHTSRGDSPRSPTWNPDFKPVAVAPDAANDNLQR